MSWIAVPAGVDQRRRRPEAGGRKDWYRISAKAADKTAEVWIYDEIGWYGTTAADFCQEFARLDATSVTLHLNSPGGDVFDGIAIGNALRDHSARVTVVVDALAASIASVIAMAGDHVVMNANSQMMIHDASGLCWGNASDMTEMAMLLDRFSNSIASAYAERAGGTPDMWRTQMRAETWFDAQEAVDAGLADEVVQKADTAAEKAAARWDLSAFGARRPAARGTLRPRAALVLSGQDTDYLRSAIDCMGDTVEAAQAFLKLPAERRNSRVSDLAQGVIDTQAAQVDEMTALLDEAGLPAEAPEGMSFAGRPAAGSGGGGGDGGPRSGRTSIEGNGTTTPSERQQRDNDALRIRRVL